MASALKGTGANAEEGAQQHAKSYASQYLQSVLDREASSVPSGDRPGLEISDGLISNDGQEGGPPLYPRAKVHKWVPTRVLPHKPVQRRTREAAYKGGDEDQDILDTQLEALKPRKAVSESRSLHGLLLPNPATGTSGCMSAPVAGHSKGAYLPGSIPDAIVGLKKLQADHKLLRRKHASLSSKTRRLERCKQSAHVSLKSLKGECSNHRSTVAELKQENEILNSTLEALQAQVAALQERLGESDHRITRERRLLNRITGKNLHEDERVASELEKTVSEQLALFQQLEARRELDRLRFDHELQQKCLMLAEQKEKLAELRKQQEEARAELERAKVNRRELEARRQNHFLYGAHQGEEGQAGQQEGEEVDGEMEGSSAPSATALTQPGAGGYAEKKLPKERLVEKMPLFTNLEEEICMLERHRPLRRLVMLTDMSRRFSHLARVTTSLHVAISAAWPVGRMDTESALEAAVALAKKLMRAEHVIIYRAKGGMMWTIAPSEFTKEQKVVPVGRTIAGYTAGTGEAVRTADGRSHAAYHAENEDLKLRAGCPVLCEPVCKTVAKNVSILKGQDMSRGAVKVVRGEHGVPFDVNDVYVLRQICHIVDLRLANLEEMQEVQKANTLSKRMGRLVKELNCQLHHRDAVQRIANGALSLLNAEACAVYFLDRKNNELAGFLAPENIQFFRSTGGLLSKSFETGAVVMVTDVRKDNRINTILDLPPSTHAHSFMLFPIPTSFGSTLAVVQAINKQADKGTVIDPSRTQGPQFSDNDKEVALAMAAQAAVVLEKTAEYRNIMDSSSSLHGMAVQGSLLDTVRGITFRLRDLLCCESVKVLLVEPGTGHMYVPAMPSNATVYHPSGMGLAGKVASTGALLSSTNATKEPEFDKHIDGHGIQVETMLCCAVHEQSGEERKCIAVLQAVNKRRAFFSSEDEAAVQAVARQVPAQLRAATMRDGIASYKHICTTLTNLMLALPHCIRDMLYTCQSVEEACLDMFDADTACLVLGRAGNPESLRFPSGMGQVRSRGRAQALAATVLEKERLVTETMGEPDVVDSFYSCVVRPHIAVGIPLFDLVAGVPLGAICVMRFKPFSKMEGELLEAVALRVSMLMTASGGCSANGAPAAAEM